MTMFSKISNYMTDLIYETLPNVDPGRREVIEYGVYMTVSEIVKISLLLIIASLLKIIPYVLGVIIIYGVQRTFLGGLHAKTHLGCVITHSAIVFGIPALSFISQIDKYWLLLIIVPFSYVTAYKYAPADMPQKPVKSKKQRNQLRTGGFILLAVLFTAAYFLDGLWSNIILFTCFIQAVLMTPVVYKITKNKYGREEASV
jgi:accessory gene regulator B